ncbi:helix-turn-helix domain-containing protein [Chitinophaga oryziterrae]|uniref:Helix-turn-helix domain-containing protein n=1 Tax=Chitinophaga oryziterrae TaxID=1031224 RepID=A0A6N8J4Q1_9BACT|nr:helix-turn-helix transcriptional regulator [Chitinophaga oryziterrae]MVT40225.1 helix-turn-helix domain-containing protein [Chitinophaga oryziterrae]
MSLGTKLKDAREHLQLTLRQVEEASGISNAYLSQLENGKILKPSANILYKLSTLYKVNLNSLLAAAGIITTSDKSAELSREDEVLNNIAFYAENLSSDEKSQVLEYIKFLRHKKKKA